MLTVCKSASWGPVLSDIWIMVLPEQGWDQLFLYNTGCQTALDFQSSMECLPISLLLLEATYKIAKVVDELNTESCTGRSRGHSVKLVGDQFETDKESTLAFSSELWKLVAMWCWSCWQYYKVQKHLGRSRENRSVKRSRLGHEIHYFSFLALILALSLLVPPGTGGPIT